MTLDLFTGIIINTFILISMSVIYSMFPQESKIPHYIRKILIGIIFSIVGFAIMAVPFDFQDGVFFDTRSILVSSTAMFFGFIPTLIVSGFLVFRRFQLGGAGAITGSLVVVSSALIGLLWRKYRLKAFQSKKLKNGELFLVGLIVHIVMLLLMFTLPLTVRIVVVQKLWFAILFLYPIGSYVIYRFYMYQRLDYYQKIKTKKSEVQYRNLFEKSRVTLLLLDSITGQVMDANETALNFYGWTLDEIKKLSIYDINALDKEDVENEMKRCVKEGKTHFDFKHILSNGLIIDVEVYSGLVLINDTEYLLSTIHDVSKRKSNEKEISDKQDELQYVSHHDFLTGLYNRYFFEEELSRLNTKRQLPLSIIMGDVNGLKLVNDTFSHLEGDKLLIEIASILKKAVRAEDIVARWGGDEFVILLPQTSNYIATRITEHITSLCHLSFYKKIPPNISLGCYTKTEIDEDVYDVLKGAEELMYRNKLLEGSSVRNGLIATLESTLVEKSLETQEHAQKMIGLSIKFAKYLTLSDDETNAITLIARLHDIGKINVNASILSKAGPLTQKEWKEVKEHPIAGGRIVGSIPELHHVKDGIIHHHEWYNGSGYPSGLKGENIPYHARIITIIDAYEVMTGGRPYKSALTHKDALKELEKNKEIQFDPILVTAFIDMFSVPQNFKL
jgi:diguanylate cyclase (GGDEF)-like protein/PAS domain S-box-containing protein